MQHTVRVQADVRILQPLSEPIQSFRRCLQQELCANGGRYDVFRCQVPVVNKSDQVSHHPSSAFVEVIIFATAQ